MNKLKTIALFIFSCLTSCNDIGPYRDLEITITNTDYAMIYFYSLPDSNQFYTRAFDINHEQSETIHFSHIPDGKLLIRVSAEHEKRLVSIDTAVDYKGRFGYGVEF